MTWDEVWLNYYFPIKLQNSVWDFEGKDTHVIARRSQSKKEKMIDIFFKWSGIIHTEASHS